MAGPDRRVPEKAVPGMRTKTRWSRLILAAGALSGLFLGGPVIPALADDADLGSTYGRVRFLEGDLSVQRTGQGEVSEGTLNSPVPPGDRLTASDGRAEIGLAGGAVLWLGGGARLACREQGGIGKQEGSSEPR